MLFVASEATAPLSVINQSIFINILGKLDRVFKGIRDSRGSSD